MSEEKELLINEADLLAWINRPPSDDDLDLARFIATRLEKFYDLENQLQQKENIIKEVREYIKEHKNLNWYVESCYIDDLLQILNKGSD